MATKEASYLWKGARRGLRGLFAENYRRVGEVTFHLQLHL